MTHTATHPTTHPTRYPTTHPTVHPTTHPSTHPSTHYITHAPDPYPNTPCLPTYTIQARFIVWKTRFPTSYNTPSNIPYNTHPNTLTPRASLHKPGAIHRLEDEISNLIKDIDSSMIKEMDNDDLIAFENEQTNNNNLRGLAGNEVSSSNQHQSVNTPYPSNQSYLPF